MIIDLTYEEAHVIEMWYSIAERESYTDAESDALLQKLRSVPEWPSHA